MEYPEGIYRSVPVAWTDVVPSDPYISVGGGRSRFRVEDLMELVRLLRESQK